MGRPRPVREVMALLGSSPLICMPLDASNAGKNYGTGGDFTANSAPYVGARGASEYISRSAKFDGSTGYLLSNSYLNKNDTNKFSCFFTFKLDSLPSISNMLFTFNHDNGIGIIVINITNSGVLVCELRNAQGSTVGKFITSSSTISSNVYYTVMCSFDFADVNKRFVYINNVAKTVTWNNYINDLISYSGIFAKYIGVFYNGGLYYYYQGILSNIYISNEYIDFSQEANRLKFVDGLGYPLDLNKQIEAGVIPEPLIYLPFDDQTNLGKNLGTGGDFTINGTVTAGADFNL